MRLFKPSLALCTALSCLSSTGFADVNSDITTALAQIQSDSVKVSQWMSDQLRVAVPYNSTAGNVIPSQLKIFGFDVGVAGVVTATKMDVPGLHTLGTQIVDTTKIDAPSRLPFPMILGQAKIGLPFGLDAGIRLGGIPERTYDKDTTRIKVKNKIVGFDVRKAIVKEGIGMPGVTLGFNYTHADGEIDWTTPFKYNNQITESGHTYDTSSDATSVTTSKWKTNSVGLQALLHKKLLFITPYIGASANHNSGHIDSSIRNAGTVTLTDPNNSANSATQAFDQTGTATSPAEKWDVRGLAGLEFSILPFMRLGLNGDFAGNRKVGGSLNLRLQFR